MDNIQDIAIDNSNMSDTSDTTDTSDTSDTSIDNKNTVSKMTEAELTLAMNKNYSYPDAGDASFMHDIYKKAEFYNHRIPERPDINEYNDIKDYRDNICARDFSLHEHQAMVSNFINPDTPYRGLLLFHGLGTGKCVSKDTLILINGSYIKIEEFCQTPIIIYNRDTMNAEQLRKIIAKMVRAEMQPIMRQEVRSYLSEVFSGKAHRPSNRPTSSDSDETVETEELSHILS